MYVRNTDTKSIERKDDSKLIIRLPRKKKYNFKMYCLKNNISMNSAVNESIDYMIKEKRVKKPNILQFIANSPLAGVDLELPDRNEEFYFRDVEL